MTTTYTKTLISDEATDDESPITETIVQDIGQSVNYLMDAVISKGTNSEKIPPTGLDYYESTWTSVADAATGTFAHGLGVVPVVVLVWASKSSAGFNNAGADVIMPSGSAADRLEFVADATNVSVENNLAATYYIKVVAW